MAFKEMTTEQKKEYGKKYSSASRKSYQKGKKYGYISCLHNHSKEIARNKTEFNQRKYTVNECNSLFDDISKVNWK